MAKGEAQLLLIELKKQQEEQRKLLDEHRQIIDELKRHQKEVHQNGEEPVQVNNGSFDLASQSKLCDLLGFIFHCVAFKDRINTFILQAVCTTCSMNHVEKMNQFHAGLIMTIIWGLFSV